MEKEGRRGKVVVKEMFEGGGEGEGKEGERESKLESGG